MDYYGWHDYVPVAARRLQALRALAALKKKGHQALPVVIDGRTIARTFWGKAWCDNLERYSDFANRLPRGRTYVRNGSVVETMTMTKTIGNIRDGRPVMRPAERTVTASLLHDVRELVRDHSLTCRRG